MGTRIPLIAAASACLFLALVFFPAFATASDKSPAKNGIENKAALWSSLQRKGLPKAESAGDEGYGLYFVRGAAGRPANISKSELEGDFGMFVLARLSKKRAAELGRGALVKPANNKTYQILLDRSAPLIGASSAFNAGLGGNGSKVCIIDSGFDYYSSELPEPAAARDFTLDDWCMDFPQSAANTRRSFNATLNVSNSSITTLNAAVWWGSASNRYDLRVWKDGSLINATGVSQSPVSNGGYWLFLDLALPSAGDYQIELLETSINASADVPTFLWGGNVSTYGGYYSNPIGCISSPNPVNTGLSKAFYNIHPQDDHGHGTHVAGIMARRGLSNSSLRGVAPNASLYIAKGLSSSGYGFDSEIAQALQWCIDQGTDIISMSLGASASANCDSEIDLLADAAFEAGVLPVIAAGNSGPSSSTISSPACSRGALAVGSTYRMDYAGPVPHSSCSDLDPRADSIACYSSRGPASGGRLKPEISAPGSSINSSYITNATASFDGTSMAAPHVSGAAAIIRQMHPSWRAQQIRAALINDALLPNSSVALPDNNYGFGRVNLSNAMAGTDSIAGSWNTSAGFSFEFYSNTTAPIALTFLWSENSTQNHVGANVSLTAPNGSTYFSGNASWLAHRIATPAFPPGNWTFSAAPSSSGGARNFSIAAPFDIFSPRITYVSLANGTTINSPLMNVSIMARYNSTRLSFAWASLDGSVAAISQAGANTTISIAGISEGAHTVIFFVNDSNGRQNSTGTYFFSSNQSKPSVAIFSPANGTAGNSTFPLSYAAADPYGSLDQVWYLVNGNYSMNLTANTTISIATEGTVNITVCANNTLGSSNCTSVMVINDLSGPVLTAQQNAFSPSTAYINTQNENFTFNSTWSDETNISRLFFEIDTVNHTATNISAWNFYAIANLSIGDHAFRWFAFDFFNKSSATNMAYIRVGFNCSGGINSTNIGYSNSSGGNALLELLLDNRTTLTASSAAISSSINIINISLLAPSAGAPNGSSFISGYEINATTNDSLSICFNYSAAINSTMNDSTIAVYRKGNTDSDWTNVTTNLDNASRLACGNVASAQTPYVLAAQNNNPAPTPTPSPTATQAQAYTGGGSADGAPSGFATSRESPTPAPTQTPIPASTPAPAAEEQPEARARDGEIFSRINETERLLENSIGALSDYSIASARKYLAKARSLVYAGRHEEALSALAYARRAIETGNAAATGGTTGKQERLAPVPRQAVGAGYVLADYAMPLYAIAAAAGLAAAIGAARLFRAKTEWNN